MTSANVTAEGRTAGLVKGAHISRAVGTSISDGGSTVNFSSKVMQSMNSTLLLMNRWHI